MKVLLIQPPVRDFYDTDIRLQPIGLAYLKAAILKHLPSVKVVIKAYHHSKNRRTIPLPAELAHLKDLYGADDKSPFSSFHHYYHFGADFEAIADDVKKENPDLVGISALFAPYYREALQCADAIKKHLKVPILLGGSFASAMPEFLLSHPAVDFVIRGEGERPLVEFLRRLQKLKRLKKPKRLKNQKDLLPLEPFKHLKLFKLLKTVPNLGYKKNGKIILSPVRENFPIEALPFPDLSDLQKENYLFEKKPLCFIVTSRGCPYRCSFCSVHETFGHRYRRRSTDNILAEMKQRYKEGYRVFDFEDDNFAFEKKGTVELCEKIARAFSKKDARLLAMNGICYWTLDREILHAMRRAGFTHLNLSLVSTDAALMKSVNRPIQLKKYRAVIKDAAKLSFKTVSYQILGLPGDSLPSMLRTMAVHAGLPVLLGASPFYLIPHSPIARKFDRPAETDIYRSRLTALGVETNRFRREDIYTLFITTRILNFLKGIPLKRNTSLKKALAAAERLDTRSRLGVGILKKLLAGKGFYHATSGGLRPQPRFRTELFFKLWRQLDKIVTQEGKTILIKGGGK